MSFRATYWILWSEARDAFRNRWVVLFAGVFAALAVALSALGCAGLGHIGVTGFGRTAVSLLHLVMVIVPLMGLLMGAMSIAVEREQGSLVTLAAQPVTLTDILLGKFLGSALALLGAITVGFMISGALIARQAGGSQLGAYLGLAAFTWLLGLSQLALGFCVSVVTRRGATAVGLALFVWLSIVLLSDLGIIGTAVVLKLSPSQLWWTSLMNPAQAFKIGAVQSIQGTLELLGPSGRYAMDVLGHGTAPLMAALLAAWILGPLVVALQVFNRRGAV